MAKTSNHAALGDLLDVLDQPAASRPQPEHYGDRPDNPAAVAPPPAMTLGDTLASIGEAASIEADEVAEPEPDTPYMGAYRAAIACGPNMMVPWFLMASYAYYQLDVSLLTDAAYDELARNLDARWDEIEHRHKHVIDRASLAAGTAFGLDRDAYPPMVVGAVTHLVRVTEAYRG